MFHQGCHNGNTATWTSPDNADGFIKSSSKPYRSMSFLEGLEHTEELNVPVNLVSVNGCRSSVQFLRFSATQAMQQRALRQHCAAPLRAPAAHVPSLPASTAMSCWGRLCPYGTAQLCSAGLPWALRRTGTAERSMEAPGAAAALWGE